MREVEQEGMTRTSQQNRALHKYCALLAEKLNESGWTPLMVIKDGVDIEWSPGLVKELLWRTSQKAVLGKRSTKDLDKLQDINAVYDIINRHIGQRCHVYVPFPCIEAQEGEKVE